jgi:hypothetical protein
MAVCLWFDGKAEEAANFYASTFPDSHVDAVRRAPGDYPAGKEGDVIMVEFTVLGMPFLGLNGGLSSNSTRRFPSRSTRGTRPKPTATGTPSPPMAVRRANAAGARIGTAFPGRSRRAH